MDTERDWQVVKRETDGELFLILGEPGNVTGAWSLTAATDFKMFNRTEDFTTVEHLPELEHAGTTSGRSEIRGNAA